MTNIVLASIRKLHRMGCQQRAIKAGFVGTFGIIYTGSITDELLGDGFFSTVYLSAFGLGLAFVLVKHNQ